MALVELRNLSFTYAGSGGDACLRDINLAIQPGEVVLLCGPSGCGKTTLTRLVNGLIPHYYEGELTGEVLVSGQNVAQQPLYEIAKQVGSVFQNPRSQFFNVETRGELAFCCENFGMEPEEILRRIDAVVAELSIEKLMGRSMFALSGGEKQRVACASVSVADPHVVVLDEPSSNLDMAAIDDLRRQIAHWKSQGKTVLVAEHRLHYLRHLADRILYMKDGRILREFSPAQLDALPQQTLDEMGLRPLALDTLYQHQSTNSALPSQDSSILLDRFHFAYKRSPACLHVDGALFPENAVVAIVGQNGAGKSTLARCLCGLEKRCKGLLLQDGEALNRRGRLKNTFMVMQDVNHQLFTESVLDEVLISLPDDDPAEAERILAGLDLLEQKERHPMSLSGGQKQRVAIASAIASGRQYILLDEPTSGLDLFHMKQVAALMKELQEAGKTLLVITHDPEFILHGCTHVLQMEAGEVTASYPLNTEGRDRLVEWFSAAYGDASPERSRCVG